MVRGEEAYQEALRWLGEIGARRVELGLARMREVMVRLGSPEKGLHAVSVAGTNGKGSTVQFLASICRAAGYRVGVFTSPHLVRMTERILLDGAEIHPSDFGRWVLQVREVMEVAPRVALTQFEILTAAALGYFAERQVDIAILEVGLGGRLDATNVVDAKVAVLTQVGLDHVDILGRDVHAIAREKVGILKEGGGLVTAVDGAVWADVVGPRAYGLRCPVRRLGFDFVGSFEEDGFRFRGGRHRLGGVALGIWGYHQRENAALACAVAEELGNQGFHFRAHHLAEGLERARHPARMERRDATERMPALLIDGAHNPDAAGVLARHVPIFLPERPRILLYGVNPTKDTPAVLARLVSVVDAVVLTRSRYHAEQDLEETKRWLVRRQASLPVLVRADGEVALGVAQQLAGPRGGICVTGSFYLIGELWGLLAN